MGIIIEVKGANEKEERERHEAFEKLNKLDTNVLKRIAEVSESEKAVNYFKTALMFAVVKKFLGI